MQDLNLPPVNLKIKTENNTRYIFDIIRKTWIVLTPEEWVRQHMIGFLVQYQNCPLPLMKSEASHQSNMGLRRTDIIVCNKAGEPLMVVECKAPDVKITQKTVEQISNYNLILKAKYLLITNGINHFGYTIDFSTRKISTLDNIPTYSEML